MSQAAAALHGALAAHRNETTGLAQHFHIQHQGQHSHQHNHRGDHRCHARLPGANRPVQSGGQRIEMHRQAENIGQGELAYAVGENQQGGGEQRRTNQRDNNFKGDNVM